ncbi:MAG: transmembrane 220 family protein [Cytophagales bacterium]|nr:transmembrane 220 family protein [Cytophaga sp.]
MNTLLRYIPIVLAILFILFCVVQYNDPDTLTWVGIYGFMACLSILVFLKKVSQWLILLAMPFYLAGFIYLWPDSYEGVTMSMGYKPGIEEARESLGLLICFVSLCVLLLIVRKQQKR